MAKGLKRKARIKMSRKAIKDKTVRIVVTWVLPAMTYDAAIHGISDTNVLKIRRTAAVACAPCARNASLTTKLLLNGDPTAAAETAAAAQFARMAWWAKARPEDAERRGASITQLRDWADKAGIGARKLCEPLSTQRQRGQAARGSRGQPGVAACQGANRGHRHDACPHWLDVGIHLCVAGRSRCRHRHHGHHAQLGC